MAASEYQSPFWNESAYLNLHPDVDRAVFVGQLPSGLDHYLLYGAWEKRNTGSTFHEEPYESRYSDVAEAIANRQFGSAFQHFLIHGQFEGRLVSEVGKDAITGAADSNQLSFWDEDTYLKLNPDVKNAVVRGELSSGLNHYLEFGLKEKRNSGSRFNEYFYLNRYKDVAVAVNRGLFQNGFEHFLRFGQYELRTPNVELQQLASLGSANLPIDPITQMMPGQSENSSRLSTDLLSLLQQFVSAPQNNSNRGSFKSNNDLLMLNSAGTDISVTINASNINNLLPSLQKIGFKTIASRPDLNFVEGKLPIAALSYIEALGTQGLLGVMPVYRPMTSKGSVTSQADFVQEVDRVRATLPAGYDGTGVKIGVMSDSYNNKGGADADISSGDLPAAGVQVLQDYSSGGSDEGRAMLQLIHDLAPGSSLAFSSVYNGQADFAQQIRNLANPAIGNAKVLVDDIFYFAEPFYQDGAIAQAVNEVVTTSGVSYFSSAGNLQNQAYETTNFNASNDTYYAGLFHDFDPGIGVDTRQRITLNNNQRIIFGLQWDDPFYTVDGVDTDLNIYLLDAGTNTVIAGSINNNINNKTPYEQMVFTNTSGSTKQYDVLIELKSGPAPGRFKYINFGSNNSGPITSEYALNSTTITPHAAATNGMAVAAIPYYNQKISESSSSLGPTTILFNPDGTPKATPEVRQKPDMAAIDGTDTTFFGSDVDSNGFPNFFGTSAAAPHAAAVAALVLQANPAFTPSQVYDRLKSTALDISSAGVDNLTGWGRINAYDAIFGSVIPTTLNFSDGLESGVLSLAYETNSTGAGRIQISSANSPAAGNYHVVMNTMLTNINANIPSLNEMTLRVNTAGFNNINLNFKQKEFSDPDNFMPTTFTGSNNSDGVALSVDGINWYRLFDLTGTNSINTYQDKTINLSTFAISNDLTLGSDVRIKFQQYNSTSGPTGGFAFDDISVTGTATNTSPAIALPGSPVNYTENDAPTIIDSSATVTDDSADFDTGTLTVDLIANGTADDRLAIQHQGNGVGQIGLDGRIVKYSGTQIGTYAGGIGIEPLVITFNSSATPTATQALLQNITYANVSQNPSTAPRTVRFVLTDGDGGTSAPVTETIDVVAINDAPIVNASAIGYDGSLNTLSQAQGWLYQNLPNGTVTPVVSGGVTTLNTNIDNNLYAGFGNIGFNLDRNAGYAIDFTAKVVSEDHTSSGTAEKNGDSKADRAGFSIIALGNDRKGIELGFWQNEIWAQEDGTTQANPSANPTTTSPGNANLLFTHAEGAAFNTTTGLIPYSLTVIGDTYTLSTGSTKILSGKLRDYTAWQPPAGFPDPYEIPKLIFLGDNTTSAKAQIELSNVTVSTNSTLSNQTVNEETDLPIRNFQITDVDSGSNTISVNARVNNGQLTVNTSISGGVTSVTNNGSNNITLHGTVAQINTTLTNAAGLVYRSDRDFNGTDTLTVDVNDGGFTGGTPLTNSKSFNIIVNGVNDAPILDLNGLSTGIDYNATFNRGGSAIGIVDSSNLSITDNDSTNLSSATVTITNPLNGAAEVLAANTSGTSISANYTYDGTTGILTLSGSDTLANYQNVLRSVTYNNTFFLPNTTARTINFVINDGSLNSATATTTITVNSPPLINLGNTTNTITRPPIESVTDAYPDDIYQFNLTNNSQLVAELVNAGGNADLNLYDTSGLLLASSQNPATQNERIEQSNLLPATYYLRVYQGGSGQLVNYRLRINNINI